MKNKHDDINFPWWNTLWSSLFWALITLLILRIAGGIALEYFDRASQGETGWTWIFRPGFWIEQIVEVILEVVVASLLIIPSFYAGMYACVRVEERGAEHEKEFETAFRAVATLTFFVLLLVADLIFALIYTQENYTDFALLTSMAAVFAPIAIVFYFFEENVADIVWPDVFEKRAIRRVKARQ